MLTVLLLVSLLPMASIGDNAAGLLIAVFGGAAASLVAAYFARPKTKADARVGDATADVTMSGDAREWAVFWSTKAQEADTRAIAAEERADSAEEVARRTVHNMEIIVDYTRILEDQVKADGHMLPPITEAVRYILHGSRPADDGAIIEDDPVAPAP